MERRVQHLVKTIFVLLLSLDLDLQGVFGNNEVESHLEMGKKLIQEGKMADALEHYNMAVSGDPSNYLTYFKRATVYLALGQSKKALPDLSKVVELKPDFHQARLQRANTNLKLGLLDVALPDYNHLMSSDNSATEEAKIQNEKINEVKSSQTNIEMLLSSGDCVNAVHLLSVAVEVSPWDLTLRKRRADCYEKLEQYQSAISDIKMTTKLVADNTEAFYRASQLYYMLGEEEDSLKEIRECLRLDPDHKTCFPFYKKVKKLNKQLSTASDAMKENRYSDAIDKLISALESHGDVKSFKLRIQSQLCHSYSKIGDITEGKHWCDIARESDPDNIDVLCDYAELQISEEEYDEAIKTYQQASQIDNQNQRVKDGLNKAQNLLKQSQKRDYYKILGVKRSASVKDINKAYRKLAKEWHPDKYEGEDKKKAEKMFYDIAAAKEVLTDKEKREKFDNGEDPLDPEQQHGPSGFHHGGFPFGGGGFTFKFHFG